MMLRRVAFLLIVIVTTLIGAANTAFPSAPAFAIYYMAVDGNDSYDGLAAAHTTGIHGPWLTPNHAVNCGDVIYAEPGIYNSSARLWNISTTVSNCPSENNIYAAQIICKDAFSCSTSSSGNGYSAVKIVASNIALQGWVLSSFHPDAACAAINPQSNTILHHVAFVNNICNGAFAEGFGSYPRAAFYGVDYQDSRCTSRLITIRYREHMYLYMVIFLMEILERRVTPGSIVTITG